MVGVADEHTRQTIKRELAIGLGVLNGLAFGRRLEVSVVGCCTAKGPGHMATQHKLLHTCHEGAHRAAFFEPLLEVAGLVQLGVQPAVFKCFWVGAEFIMRTARLQCIVCGFCGQHARFNSGMASFDAAGIEVTGIATDQCAAWKNGFGQR